MPGFSASFACLLHVLIVDADVDERATERAPGRADRCACDRHQEEPADQHAPEGSGDRSARRRVHELVQMYPPVLIARRDHRVADVDQIFLLHR